MNIYQITPTLAYGDAVSNDVLALKSLISAAGYNTKAYAQNIQPLLADNDKDILSIGKLPTLGEDSVVIYHLSTGSELNYQIANFNCKKIIRYHNITPPHFFYGYDNTAANLSRYGLEGMQFLSKKADYCLVDSEFNKQDLLSAGYSCKIDVLPILIPFDDYLQEPSQDTIKKYDDGCTNLLFTGRIVPNKRVEKIIGAFACYKKYYDPTARLFLVGSYNKNDIYYQKLVKYVDALNVHDVFFLGHINFRDILSFFRLADIYLCMSEHEGFCVPLVEAMFFDIPIIAYDKCAVKYTLGGSGFLLRDFDALQTAGAISRVLKDESLKRKILAGQRERLADFKYENVSALFWRYFNNYLLGETK